jgi:hypothetical protein
MRKWIVMFFVLTFCIAVSSAQQKWDVFGGYSLSRDYLINEAPFPMTLNGAQVAATYNVNKHFGATGEFVAYRHDVDQVTTNIQGYLFGPTGRLGLKNETISLFGDQLFGVSHFSFTADAGNSCVSDCSPSLKAFTMVSGGGVDVKLNRHFSLRPVQMEYFLQRVSVDSIEALMATRRGPVSYGQDPATNLYVISEGLIFSTGAVYHF